MSHQRKTITLIATLLLIAGPFLPFKIAVAGPSISKCVDASGHITYSDTPCAATSKAKESVKKPPKLTKQQEIDAKMRLADELNRSNEISIKQIKEDIQRDRTKLAIEKHEKECALKRVEVDRQRADAASYPYDSWWRNRAIAAEKEYSIECGN